MQAGHRSILARRYDEAEPSAREGLKRKEAALGPDNPSTIASVANLAHILSHTSRATEALPLLRRVYAAHEGLHGRTHASTLSAAEELARVLRQIGGHDAEVERLEAEREHADDVARAAAEAAAEARSSDSRRHRATKADEASMGDEAAQVVLHADISDTGVVGLRLDVTAAPSRSFEIASSLAAALSTSVSDAAVAEQIFEALDADGGPDGRVTLEEMCTYLMSRDAWCRAEHVLPLFNALDADVDGGISHDELRNGLGRHVDGKPPLLWMMALRPPPAGVGVFSDLVRERGPVSIPDAAYRAISLGQLKGVVSHLTRRCADEGWIGKRFPGGVLTYELLTPHAVNLYDVASHVILPATYGHTLPAEYQSGMPSFLAPTRRPRLRDAVSQPSYVELVADGAQRPDYVCTQELKPRSD